MDEKRYCGHCRQEIDAGAARCPHCGGDLPASGLTPPPGESAPAGPSRERSGSSRQGGARRTDTVGDLPTARAAGEEPALNWTEGMLIADRFRIVRCIGQGGMGLVYLAHDTTLDRPIALKRVPQEILFDGDARDDLRQEANRLLDLAHENIIRVHTYYDEPAWPFFAMEYLQGPTLKELLRQRKLEGAALTPEEVLGVARQVERGLTYAHGKGIIHRDLKPGNLMFAQPAGKAIAERDVIKITDFGISRVVADSTMRQTGKRSGTLPYMSPEQFRGEPASVESDIYSLAATYYELLSGKPPFYTGDISYQIVNIQPRPLANLPRPLADAVLRGLSKSPRHRPASVKELTDAMEGNAPGRVAIALRRSRKLARGLALAAAALVAVGLVVFWVHSLGGDAGGNGTGLVARAVQTPPRPAPGPGAAEQDPLVRVAKDIQGQLDDAGLRIAVSGTPLRFTLRKRGEMTLDVFWRVQFELAASDPAGQPPQLLKGTQPEKDGMKVADALDFEIPDLPEGDYILRTSLFEMPFPQGAPVTRPFRVDTTGPAFELGPVNREELVELAPGRFATYNEETELNLSTPQNPHDINRAHYQIYAEALGRFGAERFKIADTRRWRVTLVPGQNRFQVVAADELENESVRSVRIDRLLWEVVKFEVDRAAGGVAGNRASVRGELKIESAALDGQRGPSPGGGERRMKVPALRYLVNKQPVVPEESAEPSAKEPVFRARLYLPQATNEIEVRYQWGDDALRSFAVASSARMAVEVPAPRIELASLPSQTNRTTIEVAGKVKPYFEGLEVHLQHELMGSYRLPLKPAGGEAEFLELRQLSENKSNRFSITCTYRGQELGPAGPTVEVYCDLNQPRLLDPVEFRPQGEFLQVVVVPTEPLARLQMKGPEPEWRQLAHRNDGRYVAILALPREKTEFQFRMLDLAGNESLISQVCEAFDPVALADAEGDGGGKAVGGTAREGEGSPAPAGFRRVVRSAFLKQIDLDFVPCGNFDEEMGATEVNQRAWNAFLRDRLQSKSPEGDPRLPMTIGERFDPTLLHLFALWLTEKSADGYRYSVPTVNQWLASFSGKRHPREAVEAIRAWFEGPGKRFVSSPRVRYGITDVLRTGERPENRTPTGLLDMESNLQEIVTDENGLWYVIGGYNLFREHELVTSCTVQRLYNLATETWAGRFTGFRVVRRPEKRE